MKHIVMFSGGVGSWAAAKRVAAEHFTDDLTLLFADTFCECEDTYRGLIEMAANVFGVPLWKVEELAERALKIQKQEDALRADGTIDEALIDLRKQQLKQLAADTMVRLPQLKWINEGRTVWEVFADERMLGNTRFDPCSKILKRQLQDAYRNEHFTASDTVCYVGLDWSELHRMEGTPNKPGLRQRMAAIGWRYEAPMTAKPYRSKFQMLSDLAEEGIREPRLYSMGYPHGNCKGLCVKAGIGQYILTRKAQPRLFAFGQAREKQIRQIVGDYTILTEQRNGVERNLTLEELGERVESNMSFLPFDQMEWGGCGCAIDDSSEPESTTALV